MVFYLSWLKDITGTITLIMGSKKKVLIVEDNAVQAMTLKKLFERLNHTVVAVVGRGEQAVRKTAKLQPDLIIMDIFLDGDMTGIQAMEQIREDSGVPVIYISGNSDPFYRRLAEKTSSAQFFCKPVNHNELQEAAEYIFAANGTSGRDSEHKSKSIWPFGLFF